MPPKLIYKTKKWVSILILIFGVMMLLQGVFPDEVQKGLDRIPNASDKIENMTK